MLEPDFISDTVLSPCYILWHLTVIHREEEARILHSWNDREEEDKNRSFRKCVLFKKKWYMMRSLLGNHLNEFLVAAMFEWNTLFRLRNWISWQKVSVSIQHLEWECFSFLLKKKVAKQKRGVSAFLSPSLSFLSFHSRTMKIWNVLQQSKNSEWKK